FWPRTWDPARTVVEDRLGEDVIAELERRGHRVTRAGAWSLGRLSAVTRDPATGLLGAAANPRGMQGYAGGRGAARRRRAGRSPSRAGGGRRRSRRLGDPRPRRIDPVIRCRAGRVSRTGPVRLG